jgi:hypothetical protein
MDAMVAVLTDGFSKSAWCQQEVGFALGGVRSSFHSCGAKTRLALSAKSKRPPGAIGRRRKSPEIDRLLAKDSRTMDRLEKAKDTADDEVPF